MLLFAGWPGPPVCSSEPPGGHTFQSSPVCLPTWSGCSACWSAWRKLLQGPGKGREHIQDVMYQKHIVSVSVSNLNIISSYRLKQMLESDPQSGPQPSCQSHACVMTVCTQHLCVCLYGFRVYLQKIVSVSSKGAAKLSVECGVFL